MINKKQTYEETRMKEKLGDSVELIKILLVLLVNKLGVERKDVANAMGISKGELSKMLNPKKYKKDK